MPEEQGTPPCSPRALQQQLERAGHVRLPGLVDDALVESALRRLNLEIFRCGLSADQIAEWKDNTFWPSLRSEPEIVALRRPIEAVLDPQPGECWGDAQILLRFPDEAAHWPLEPHVDRLPEWAGDRRYRAIAGVALTRSTTADGCLTVWPGSHVGESGPPEVVELDAGDVIVMHPRLGHSSTLNRGGHIRYAVYFRLLTAGTG